MITIVFVSVVSVVFVNRFTIFLDFLLYYSKDIHVRGKICIHVIMIINIQSSWPFNILMRNKV